METEITILKIKPQYKKTMLLVIVYNPPKNPKNLFLDSFYDLLADINNRNLETLIMGDFNIDYVKKDNYTARLKNIAQNFSYTQLIKDFTRVTRKSQTLIDHVYFNNVDKIMQS